VDRPELWPAMGCSGRAKVEREYDSKALNDRLETLYRTLITDHADKRRLETAGR
jgi:hypothetical protein